MSEPPKPITRLAGPEEMIDRSGPRRKNELGRKALNIAILAWLVTLPLLLGAGAGGAVGAAAGFVCATSSAIASVVAVYQAAALHLRRTKALWALVLSALQILFVIASVVVVFVIRPPR